MSNLSEWRVRIFTEGEVYKLGMPKRAELSMLKPPRMVYEKLVDGVWTEGQPTDEEIGQTPLGFDWLLWKRRREQGNERMD